MPKSLYNRHNEIFLELLRRSRESVPLRQADLAMLLGRDQGTVSRVENGERRLDVVQLRDWLRALGVDFRGFMGQLDERLDDYPISQQRVHAQTHPSRLVALSETDKRRRR
ncbi:helix-turn-helix domain-containing protein [Sphaerotilaceae bacterium SBD11-9]